MGTSGNPNSQELWRLNSELDDKEGLHLHAQSYHFYI